MIYHMHQEPISLHKIKNQNSLQLLENFPPPLLFTNSYNSLQLSLLLGY